MVLKKIQKVKKPFKGIFSWKLMVLWVFWNNHDWLFDFELFSKEQELTILSKLKELPNTGSYGPTVHGNLCPVTSVLWFLN